MHILTTHCISFTLAPLLLLRLTSTALLPHFARFFFRILETSSRGRLETATRDARSCGASTITGSLAAQGPMVTCYHFPLSLSICLSPYLSLRLSLPSPWSIRRRFSRLVSLPIPLSVLCILLPHDSTEQTVVPVSHTLPGPFFFVLLLLFSFSTRLEAFFFIVDPPGTHRKRAIPRRVGATTETHP